jgi:hypothetical protein
MKNIINTSIRRLTEPSIGAIRFDTEPPNNDSKPIEHNQHKIYKGKQTNKQTNKQQLIIMPKFCYVLCQRRTFRHDDLTLFDFGSWRIVSLATIDTYSCT